MERHCSICGILGNLERQRSIRISWNANVPLEVDVLINDLAELGELIRRRRTDHGLSQNDLADKVGTTRQWVSRLEKGKNDIGTARLLAVLDILELNLEIRPPRLESATTATRQDSGVQSLIASETVLALVQMSEEARDRSRMSGTFLSNARPMGKTLDPSPALLALVTKSEPDALEAGRRRILDANLKLKLSQRPAARAGTESGAKTGAETEPE